ncbi:MULTISPECIES: hypothetical protein [Bradyrhizobium]|uniref:Uncharacterized protein n=1 Tax=Bradyrhizobium stylosanthis TaxID=1803665 RepID=A0A560DXC5_9BRAD|nr:MULTISPECIES: hypothetical protein [Bradyrhizobium]MBR1172385.1 hypothetical protein [Bradyrhizobium sp. KB893862 SZCCT0404]TWB01792.1 hypothetical protein FBZ96_103573 [Bradyrhizobium stylosanthis]
MKILVIAAAVLALACGSAEAQGRRSPNDTGAKPADNKPKVDEKAYKAALERIPEPKEKYDPWGGARPAEPAKNEPAKKPK